METLSSSEQASIESGSIHYKQEISTDSGRTWKDLPFGMTLDEFRAQRAELRTMPIEVDRVEDFTPLNVVAPQSDPNEPLPYEIYDARVNSDGMLEKVSDAEDYKVLSCGFGSSGYSPGGVSWIPATASQERKAKWRKRFRMKGRKNV